MNDEIKVILDYFQKDVDKYEESKKYLMQKYGYDEEAIDNISQHERHVNTKKLLDYITNLQHTEDLYNQLLKDYDELQQENERLKLEKDTKSASEIICENLHDVYKSRCEKAVEYLKNNCYIGNCINTYEAIDITNVMDILNGRSDE